MSVGLTDAQICILIDQCSVLPAPKMKGKGKGKGRASSPSNAVIYVDHKFKHPGTSQGRTARNAHQRTPSPSPGPPSEPSTPSPKKRSVRMRMLRCIVLTFNRAKHDHPSGAGAPDGVPGSVDPMTP